MHEPVAGERPQQPRGELAAGQLQRHDRNPNDVRGGGGTCFGDSGGPVFLDGYLVAVTSNTYTSNCRYLGGYQRVDIEVVQDWLASAVGFQPRRLTRHLPVDPGAALAPGLRRARAVLGRSGSRDAHGLLAAHARHEDPRRRVRRVRRPGGGDEWWQYLVEWTPPSRCDCVAAATPITDRSGSARSRPRPRATRLHGPSPACARSRRTTVQRTPALIARMLPQTSGSRALRVLRRPAWS